MRKGIYVFLLTTILAVTFYGGALAADALYRMLHADEVASFQKDQDAFIVGQLVQKQDKQFTVKVLRVISGNVISDKIKLSDDFTFGWGQTGLVPVVNDFGVMSLKKNGSFYKKAWGIFKADQGDYKSLRLLPENAPSPGLLGDLTCIEWYVNSGGQENDFSFDSTKAFVKRPNGQILQIYPKTSSEFDKVKILNQLPEEKQNIGRVTGAVEFPYLILIAVNLFSFMLVGYDKQRARNNGWRIPELNLFMIALLGGAVGVFLGMKVFRHKTKHYSFAIGIPLLIGLNVITFYLLSGKF